MKVDDEINLLKTVLLQYSQVMMDIQKTLMAQNNCFPDISSRLESLEAKVKSLEGEGEETASDDVPNHNIELKSPIQNTSSPNNVPVMEINYIS